MYDKDLLEGSTQTRLFRFDSQKEILPRIAGSFKILFTFNGSAQR